MKIGKTDISFHWSALFIVALLIGHHISRYGDVLKGFFVGALLGLLLLGSVLLHEMSHIKAAERLGYDEPNNMKLMFFGGIAKIPQLDKVTAWHEFLIASAGPMCNFILALIAFIIPTLIGFDFAIGDPFGKSLSFIQLLLNGFFWYNIVIGIFNLIPAFPMDGGRILRSILSIITNKVIGTTIAVYTAWVFGAIFLLLGAWKIDLILVVIAGLVIIASKHELDFIKQEEIQ